MFEVPAQYFYRLHHVRPRFKSQIENVLIFMATNISDLGKMGKLEFKECLNDLIRDYPGNNDIAIKTVNNWRTEISALFGLFIEDEDYTEPGLRSKELSEDQDLVKFFKTFLFSFEYPGGHSKNKEIVKQCQAGINFKPAKYILNLYKVAEEFEKKSISLTKAEVTHCIFNDLRCTRDNEDPLETWFRIKENRLNKVVYDGRGDVIRYAGDVLDYMDIANLLRARGQDFYLNKIEKDFISVFRESSDSFQGYKRVIGNESVTIEDIKDIRIEWFRYVNREITYIDFSTDLELYMQEESDYIQEKKVVLNDLEEHLKVSAAVSTAIVGSSGESLIISHEKQKLRHAGLDRLTRLVNFIPTPLGVGYDIQSFEDNGTELRKYIEVKTTVSNRTLTFNSFRITPNEWRTAKSVKDRYFIYRLQLSQHKKKLFILEDLYGKYVNGDIQLVQRSDGYDVRFFENAGYEEIII